MKICRDISPLRYPGSKQKLVPYIEKILTFNCISPDTIVEPFVGGGSVTLSLITNGIVNNAIISDFDPLVNSFWAILFSDPKVLVNFIEKVKINLSTFYKFKEVSYNPANFDIKERAKACLFLNRTSFSGIIASSAGPIGGSKQESIYRIDCRFNKESIIEKIEYLSAFKKQIIVLPSSWKKTISYSIKKYGNQNKMKKLLFYLDPPFYHKAECLYGTFFNHKQHVELASYLKKFGSIWILSYDNTPEIKKLYDVHVGKSLNIELPYSINSHSKRIASELIITPLKLPLSLNKLND